MNYVHVRFSQFAVAVPAVYNSRLTEEMFYWLALQSDAAMIRLLLQIPNSFIVR